MCKQYWTKTDVMWFYHIGHNTGRPLIAHVLATDALNFTFHKAYKTCYNKMKLDDWLGFSYVSVQPLCTFNPSFIFIVSLIEVKR